MKLSKLRKWWVITVSVTTWFLLIPLITNAQPIKATVYEVTLDSDKYSGKMVQVEGIVKSVMDNTFELTPDNSSISLGVSFYGKLAIKEGDYVRVVGRYKKKVASPPCAWYNKVNASTVKKVERPICPDE